MIILHPRIQSSPAARLGIPVSRILKPRHLDGLARAGLLLDVHEVGVAFVSQILLIDGVEKNVRRQLRKWLAIGAEKCLRLPPLRRIGGGEQPHQLARPLAQSPHRWAVFPTRPLVPLAGVKLMILWALAGFPAQNLLSQLS